MRICSIEGCERKHRAKDMCKMHYNQWYFDEFPEMKHRARSHSRAMNAKRRLEDLEGANAYSRVHMALKTAYGKAGGNFCVNFDTCQSWADDWALKNDSNEIIYSKHYHWSENINDYMAMCRICHSEYDKAAARDTDESNIERGYN